MPDTYNAHLEELLSLINAIKAIASDEAALGDPLAMSGIVSNANAAVSELAAMEASATEPPAA